MKRFILTALGAAAVAAVLMLITMVWINSIDPLGENAAKVDYQKLLLKPDAELVGNIVTTQGSADDYYEWRLTTFYPDNTTAKVQKDLLKARYEGPENGWTPSSRYSYFRADGTLETVKDVHQVSVFGASCRHKSTIEHYSPDGKVKLAAQYFREDGQLAATFEQKAASDVWKHMRLDNSLSHVQECFTDSYVYEHYRRDGKQLWWRHEYTYGRNGKTPSDIGKVFFDWDGQPLNKEYSRRTLFGGNGYSISRGAPPLPLYEDSYTGPSGTLEYRQTWAGYYFADTDKALTVLQKLEILSADGKTVARVITLKPQPFGEKQIIETDELINANGTRTVLHYVGGKPDRVEAVGADGKVISTRKSNLPTNPSPPASMFHGFNHSLHDMVDENEHDI